MNFSLLLHKQRRGFCACRTAQAAVLRGGSIDVVAQDETQPSTCQFPSGASFRPGCGQWSVIAPPEPRGRFLCRFGGPVGGEKGAAWFLCCPQTVLWAGGAQACESCVRGCDCGGRIAGNVLLIDPCPKREMRFIQLLGLGLAGPFRLLQRKG